MAAERFALYILVKDKAYVDISSAKDSDSKTRLDLGLWEIKAHYYSDAAEIAKDFSVHSVLAEDVFSDYKQAVEIMMLRNKQLQEEMVSSLKEYS